MNSLANYTRTKLQYETCVLVEPFWPADGEVHNIRDRNFFAKRLHRKLCLRGVADVCFIVAEQYGLEYRCFFV